VLKPVVFRVLFLVPCVLPASAVAQGFRGSKLAPVQIELTRDSIERLLKALPEIGERTAGHQSQFLARLGGGGGGGAPPQMNAKEMKALNAVFTKHGFRMDEFVMQVSALLATFFVLDPDAFEARLPNEDKPEIKAIFQNPNIPQIQKDALRKQIAFAQANKDMLRKQWEQMTSIENKNVVKPMMKEIKAAFEKLESLSKKGPHAKAKKH